MPDSADNSPFRLASELGATLAARGWRVTCAESCTGGGVACAITEVAGSSRWFETGFVTYANDIKTAVLGVQQTTLATHGAVSEQVVREMALGALERSGADYAIAVSGIAGPEGGTEDKPVGTVWLAWGSVDKLQTACLLWPVERGLFQTVVAAAALDMVRRRLLGIASEPRYFSQRRAR